MNNDAGVGTIKSILRIPYTITVPAHVKKAFQTACLKVGARQGKQISAFMADFAKSYNCDPVDFLSDDITKGAVYLDEEESV